MTMSSLPPDSPQQTYWDAIADEYQRETRIACAAFHLGPLLPAAGELGLLPAALPGRRCLEVGAGAAQNSICLAKAGARCVATDISARQLDHARRLAAEHGVELELHQVSMQELNVAALGRFDFVHSTYALPFVDDPGAVIAELAELLNPGGMLLVTVGHPAFAGEWLQVDEDEGLFLTNYFRPPADVRETEDGRTVRSRCWPLATWVDWLLAAGLRLTRFLEPEPVPLPALDAAEIRRRVPYDSADWRALYHHLARVPVVAVFQAMKETGPG